MPKLIKLLRILDNNLIKLMMVGFFVVIPLVPKLPLRNVDYTYVSVRFDDLYVAIFSLIFFIQVWRKKIAIWTQFLAVFILFWLAVLLSYLYGYFIQNTIADIHLGFLNFARRIEYMIVFFIAASAVQSKKDFTVYLCAIVIVFTLVCLYGIGQKFLGWPAVQTMNPEYAKGYILYLDSWARISSTFAGHYDLAAYLVFLMPVVLGLYLERQHFGYLVIFIISIVTMILTASRISYGSYIIAITLFLLFVRRLKLLIFVIILTIALTPLSDNLTKRISRTFKYQKIYIDPITNRVIVPKDMKPDDLPPGDFIIGKITAPKDNIDIPASNENIDNSIDAIKAKEQIKKQIITEAAKSGKKLTPEEIELAVNEKFRSLIPQNSFVPDISQSTRLQVEWPRAIAAFIYNPLLGKGPSSITEATDNDYLRWLGEFGLLGTTLFIVILYKISRLIWSITQKVPSPRKQLYYGVFFGLISLLINATYIDVFEASKVAYTFWSLMGIFTGTYYFYYPKSNDPKNKLFHFNTK